MSRNLLPKSLLDRTEQHAREWRLLISESFETETSVISKVSRDGHSLILKVVKREGDEWLAGSVLSAFDGHGVVRVHEHTGGAMVLERLQPGSSLSEITLNGNDEDATEILANIIEKMPAREPPNDCPTVKDWAKGFDRYLATGDQSISRPLVESAQRIFAELGASQGGTRLLHGDLHHYNVLFDSKRGWLAIDPKGVIGELDYEIGAILRNPFERPDLFLSRPVIEGRLKQLTNRLAVNYERTIQWAFAQAVLSEIWNVEDGFAVNAANPGMRLAEIIRPMLATV